MRIFALAALAATIVSASLAPTPAHAGSLLSNVPQSTCTGINCGGFRFGGTYQFDQFNQADPFVTQVYTGNGECLRIDVLSEETDLELTLIGPDGKVWRNDDRSDPSFDNRPLLKVQNTGATGWFVLQVARYNGTGPGANFTAAYGRYNVGNPNCATPTVPVATSTLAKQK